ncbi:MAG TPA: YfiR family protein [Verrucomicrobiae bacterium]|nr:YfiR family protein [Verrucomicrobiae bacterium]
MIPRFSIQENRVQPRGGRGLGAGIRRALGWILIAGLLAGPGRPALGQASLPEPEVKALFLFNFAKYVDWPADSFASASDALTIGIIGHNICTECLQKAVEGKKVSGRSVVVRQIEKPEEILACQLVFVSDSEKRHLEDIFNQLHSRPVLVVGDSEKFARQGGVIGFVKKDGKVRLEVNLNAARKARLEISSKLLAVADEVIGR